MSLVERAIKKLQESAKVAPKMEPAVELRESATGPQVTGATTASEPSPSFTQRKRRMSEKVVDINLASLRGAGLLPPENQERQIADEYRQIKRPLIANAIGRGVPKVANGHVIMTTSALPNEGKTFTSINLALSLALEKDISVVLVDADVAKPHISRILGIERDAGLLDVLTNDSLDVESLIMRTSIPNLSVLSAGHTGEAATELLASSHMERVVSRLGAYDPNRIVLLDSPPLLLTSESRALAGIVGQVVLVVRADVTLQGTVLDALSHIGQNKAIGLILNQCERGPAETYHYGQSPYREQVA